MKRKMLAGLVLLNLCVISLDVTAGEVSISNQEVLDQLVDLRNFIDEKRDFTKQSAKGLKPVAVQYRSSASKVDGIVYCNLSFNTDALHLSIAGYSVQADGTPLSIIINVIYEWTEYVGYTIKSAKINATKSFALEDIAIDGDVDVTGDVSITGDLEITGDAKIFENIVDKDGNKRFIDIVGAVNPLVEGLTGTYCRASLSGTHLLVVLAGTIADESVLTNGMTFATFELPQWIRDKIVPVWSTYIERKSVTLWADDWSSQEDNMSISKVSNGVAIISLTPVTLTKERKFRVQFDLLIDNAESE